MSCLVDTYFSELTVFWGTAWLTKAAKKNRPVQKQPGKNKGVKRNIMMYLFIMTGASPAGYAWHFVHKKLSWQTKPVNRKLLKQIVVWGADFVNSTALILQ